LDWSHQQVEIAHRAGREGAIHRVCERAALQQNGLDPVRLEHVEHVVQQTLQMQHLEFGDHRKSLPLNCDVSGHMLSVGVPHPTPHERGGTLLLGETQELRPIEMIVERYRCVRGIAPAVGGHEQQLRLR